MHLHEGDVSFERFRLYRRFFVLSNLGVKNRSFFDFTVENRRKNRFFFCRKSIFDAKTEKIDGFWTFSDSLHSF